MTFLVSIPYVKDSLKKIDEKSVEFKLVNRVDSGSSTITCKILWDGEDVTSKATMKISGQEAKEVKPSMWVSSYYGDEVLVTIRSDTPIETGLHRVEVSITVHAAGQVFSERFEVEL